MYFYDTGIHQGQILPRRAQWPIAAVVGNNDIIQGPAVLKLRS